MRKAGRPSSTVYHHLQEERRLSAEALARPGSVTDALRRQRQLTDDAVRAFQALSGETADSAPGEVRGAVAEVRQALGRLAEQRSAIDRAAVDQPTAFAYYTDLIAVDLRLLTALGHVDDGEVTWTSRTLVNAFWAKEMLAREDAVLARGWPSGKLGTADYQQVQQAIGAQNQLFTVQVVPYLPAAEAGAWRELMTGPAWQAKSAVEQALLRPNSADAGGTVKLPPAQDQWRQALDQLNPQLVKAIETRTDGVVRVGEDAFRSPLARVVPTTLIGLIAVVAVTVTSWRLTRSLRRRIKDLYTRAEDLERTLPEVVERLARGEQADVEAGTRAVAPGTGAGITAGMSAGMSAGRPTGRRGSGTDELARLGEALDLARAAALASAVRQAEQHRGFERLLQRIARRSQLLTGQQLRKLDELERKLDDPEVLEGLSDLDRLTARLRRHEENLVILAGGNPHRRRRKPVPLLDVLRSAQGEVRDHRRILLDVEGHPWLSERAVGPLAHVLAELMENAVAFSRPPTPVEVRAAMVGRGLAVEIEDRGLGMDPPQYDAANRLMSRPPRTDVLAQADDVRLGFPVVARLAADTGLTIEFRPSAFGGTRVVVLVPAELVIDGDAGLPDATPVEPSALVRRARRAALAAETGDAPGSAPEAASGSASEPEPAGARAAAVQPPETVLVPIAGGQEPAEAFAHVEYLRPSAQQSEQRCEQRSEQRSEQRCEQPSDLPVEQPAAAGQPVGHGTARPGDGNGDRPAWDTPVDGTAVDDPAAHDPVADPTRTTAPAPAPASAGAGYDAPAYPDIAYAKVTPAEAPYADEQYRPADHYRLAERRERREYASATPLTGPSGAQPPLPQRVRQAGLAAELRVPRRARADRTPGTAGLGGTGGAGDAGGSSSTGGSSAFGGAGGASPAQQPAGAASPVQRPARRSGAAIGAFQRQSRAARGRGGGGQDSGEQRLLPRHPSEPGEPAPDHRPSFEPDHGT
ncbi:nitrate- and nitrite sensing domain-containing protein [Kitasatospora sp. NPDC127111]|uniref:sensor histidine kinase n=1 Tax=Kitasatospora sp. NPDC127111 TaxID=3345363 RepID=UPI003638EA9F